MRRYLFACLGLLLSLAASATSPAPVQAATINPNIGIGLSTGLNSGRAINCWGGARILRNRGFWDVRRADCRGRIFVYRARRGGNRYEISVNAQNGRVVSTRRMR